MIYYYAPAFLEIDGDMEGCTSPGKDTGGGCVSAITETPPSVKSLKLDEGASRFVLQQPDTVSISLPGWEIKTKEEVNTDYPGLIP
ncbi:hypothetical protein N9917_04385 [Deltaproteobacteria bacterium]|nr:hypothetical protein [Deltaproteobacteria bacterium]